MAPTSLRSQAVYRVVGHVAVWVGRDFGPKFGCMTLRPQLTLNKSSKMRFVWDKVFTKIRPGPLFAWAGNLGCGCGSVETEAV